ncbi:MAG: hypothetical protein HKP36_17025 [Myxococcales bacterium]|nr:hypothetical protein [Deltaproteobacteria bacterium]MBT8483283.1 hypothetical protein [Deltaproteobacteria bacterium]NNK05740.1 hypothetical protein [Myxococcales bacterium]NNL26142.1 hypothetical protein [Myxococcales bacterium]RZV54718.1 MAG: hypothetical protein EX268_05155 [Deltaproteobacteria bacterium]
MGFRLNTSRLLCLFVSILGLSCAEEGGPVLVDAQWNLTCPADSEVDCGSLATETCLGSVGQRAILGVHGELACTGDAILAVCESVDRPDGTRNISLEANVDRGDRSFPKFAFELGARIDPADNSVESCNVTITEDEVPYNVGGCGEEPPSMAQPCQLSNISTGNGEVSFAIECRSLISSVTGTSGFDVGAVGGGPTPIQFANCRGL